MIPKEKAIELFDKMLDFTDWHEEDAKQCALIAVDEILEVTKTNWATQYQKNGETIIKKGITYKKYWEEVKKEIQKL